MPPADILSLCAKSALLLPENSSVAESSPRKIRAGHNGYPQKTRGIKHHPPLSDSDRGGLVLDTFGICLWREQGRRAAPREKSVGRCARKWGAEERKDGVDVELRDFV